MIEGACHCGAVKWQFTAVAKGATACNCTICRRYGALWIYDFESEGVTASGPTSIYIRGKAIEFHFCSHCGCVTHWRSQVAGEGGRRRMAVNVRLSEPASVLIDHFEDSNVRRLARRSMRDRLLVLTARRDRVGADLIGLFGPGGGD
jgi:hypothetical protein